MLLFVVGMFGAATLFSACSTLAPGADAVEVRAEQSIGSAADTLDLFVKMEADAGAMVRVNAPAVHEFAEWLRAPMPYYGTNLARGLVLVDQANQARRAYKAIRGPEAKDKLTAAIAALTTAMTSAQADLTVLGEK